MRDRQISQQRKRVTDAVKGRVAAIENDRNRRVNLYVKHSRNEASCNCVHDCAKTTIRVMTVTLEQRSSEACALFTRVDRDDAITKCCIEVSTRIENRFFRVRTLLPLTKRWYKPF
jgi:hypothetical protein